MEYTFQDPGLSGFSNPARLAYEEAARLFPSRRLNVLLSMGYGAPSLIQERDRPQAFDLASHFAAVSSDAERQHEELAKMFMRLWVEVSRDLCQFINAHVIPVGRMSIFDAISRVDLATSLRQMCFVEWKLKKVWKVGWWRKMDRM
jgi:hypothetical protein